MDRWAWEQMRAWLELRAGLPVGAWLCALRGPTAGSPRAAAARRRRRLHAIGAASENFPSAFRSGAVTSAVWD
ncbi:MAG: hypothetical protein M3065_18695 [Actinomycetota bacterium]|nr:hypothetical protein [Actinomycetota bacterium]